MQRSSACSSCRSAARPRLSVMPSSAPALVSHARVLAVQHSPAPVDRAVPLTRSPTRPKLRTFIRTARRWRRLPGMARGQWRPMPSISMDGGFLPRTGRFVASRAPPPSPRLAACGMHTWGAVMCTGVHSSTQADMCIQVCALAWAWVYTQSLRSWAPQNNERGSWLLSPGTM